MRNESMTSLREFRCEVCGIVTSNPIHWCVIRCGDSEPTVHRWNSEAATAPGVRHYCGEATAEAEFQVAPRRRSEVVGAGLWTLTAAMRTSPSIPPVAIPHGLRH